MCVVCNCAVNRRHLVKNETTDILLLSALSENYEAIYYVDFDENYITPYRMSSVIEEKFGDFFKSSPSYEEAMTAYVEAVVFYDDKEEMLKRADSLFIKNKLADKRSYAYDFRVERDGEMQFYRLKVANLDGIGELHKAVVGFANVTMEAERINELLASQAMLTLFEHDELTNLYTRETFFKKVEEYIKENPEEQLLIWISDVQGLKAINDKYGMEVGDEVLKIMAGGASFFPNFIFGGRIEGDKFSALMHDNGENVGEILYNALNYNKDHFPVPNVIIKHGIYHIKQNDNLSIRGMCDRALLALQSIKGKFGDNICEYSEKLRNDLLMNRQIIENAEKALVNKEFCLYFQPKIDAKTREIAGAEALVRWNHPEFGFISPADFIPVFEQNGFIQKLDMYIWEEVCKIISVWTDKGIPLVPVSVNVSRNDYEDENLADRIKNLVDSYNVPRSLFELEVTESAYSDNPDIIVNTTKKLHEYGFIIALDDFGTGYSSMIALSSLTLDIMKLDMSLIHNDIPGTDKNVLEFSVELAKMMKLKIVAEGVETQQQAERICDLGGDYIQGYYYSKPLSLEEYEAFVMNH